MSIQDRIKVTMEKEKMKKSELAEKINAPYSTVQSWLVRNSDPGSSYINSISKALNVSIQWLITGEEINIKLPEDQEQLLYFYTTADSEGQERILEQAKMLSKLHPAGVINLQNTESA